MAQRIKKIILIGSEGYEQSNEDVSVKCFSWNKISKIHNLKDFDTIILNLLPFENNIINVDDIRWEFFVSLLNFSSTMDVLIHGGKILILGDPRFKIKLEVTVPDKKRTLPFLFWTGILFYWDSLPGDTVIFNDNYAHSHFEKLINYLIKWNYSLNSCKLNADILPEHFNLNYLRANNIEISLGMDFFCYNRYGNALAFSVWHQYLKKEHGTEIVHNNFGPITFLPKISLNEDETILLILRDICGVEAHLPEPEWLEKYNAPGQNQIDEKIHKIRVIIEKSLADLQDANKERERVRECLKLLYEREYALEPVVRDILRGFGAQVEEPEENNKEDGWIVVEVDDKKLEGVLEIKSTKSNTFSEDGRKQILDWIDRGRILRQKNYKGIFVGNSAVDKPLDERPWAFSDSWTKAAELSGICVIKTEDLYSIYLLNANDKLDVNQFWRDLFHTNGIFEMKKYYDALGPKEKTD